MQSCVAWKTLLGDLGRPSIRSLLCNSKILCNTDLTEIFHQLDQPDRQVDATLLPSLLRWCGNSKALFKGKLLHLLILESEIAHHVHLTSLLVQMYAQCGSPEDALAMFANLQLRDVSLWNVIVRSYTQQGQFEPAFKFFNQMQHEGDLPNEVSFVYILSAYASQGALVDGKRMHTRIVGSMFESDVFVGTTLITLYGKCGGLQDAWRVFEKMPQRNVASWTAMIVEYTQHGQSNKALQLFEQMKAEGVSPNKVTYVNILVACADQAALVEGKHLHACNMDVRFESDVVMGTALVNMYGKCGSLEGAETIYSNMPNQNVVSWSAMIAVYARYGHVNQGLQLFQQMQLEGVIPNRSTFLSIFAACARQGIMAAAKQIHACILNTRFEADTVLRNGLISMYGKCGSVLDAQKVFYKMSERNIVSWNAMIAVHNEHGQAMDSLQLFRQMVWERFIPNNITFISILSACASLSDLAEGKWIHGCILESRFELDVVLGTALVNMYGKCGSPEESQRVFDKMLERDTIAWNAMIAVRAEHQHSKEALQLFNQMQRGGERPDKVTFVNSLVACSSLGILTEGRRIHTQLLGMRFQIDVVLGNTLLNMYGKCGNLEHAVEVFEKMLERTVVSWTVMIALFAQNGLTEESLQLFHKMQEEGIMPNKVTYVSLLDTCANQAVLVEGRKMHLHILDNGFDLDVAVRNAMVSMYGKCGSLEDAWRTFDNMPEQDIISWNAMISAHAQHGQGVEALQLLCKMHQDRAMPNNITCVNILTACSHAGLLDDGCHFFESMHADFGILPTVDHYNCMIDLLARAGLLEEAENMINTMPYQPTSVSFMSLLSACKHLAAIERGLRNAKNVFEFCAEDDTPLVMLFNIYATGRGAGMELL